MNMNKIASIVVMAVVLATSVFAGELRMMEVDSFSGTRTDSAAALNVYIPARDGVIYNQSLCLDVSTNANVTIYRGKYSKEMAAAASSATNVWIHTTSSNKVAGFTPTSSDYIIVNDSTGTGYQLSQIIEAKGYTNATRRTEYGLATAITAADGDDVYFVDATYNLTIPGKASTDQTNLKNLFTSYRDQPLCIQVPTTAGTCVVGGTIKVLR